DEGPVVLAGNLSGKPVHFVIVTANADHVGAVDERVEDLALFEVSGDKNVGLEAGGSSVRRDGIGEVARGCAGDGLKAQFARPAQGHAHNAVFEGEGGVIDAVILDPEFAQADPFG